MMAIDADTAYRRKVRESARLAEELAWLGRQLEAVPTRNREERAEGHVRVRKLWEQYTQLNRDRRRQLPPGF